MASNRIEHFLADIAARARRRHPDVDLQHALGRAGRLHRGARPAARGRARDRRPPRPVGQGARRPAGHRQGRRPRPRRASRRPALRRLGGPRRDRPGPPCGRRGDGELDERAPRARPGRAGDDPLHLRHHRQPQGRGARPTTTSLYEALSTLEAAGLGRDADPGELPAARAHRRAGARALRPADRGQPHATPSATRPSCSPPSARSTRRRSSGCRGCGRRSRPASRPSSRPTPTPPTSSSCRTRWPPGSPGCRPRRSAATMTPEIEAGLRARPTRRSSASSSCSSASTRSSGPARPPPRCRSRSRSSWPASASRSTTSTA